MTKRRKTTAIPRVKLHPSGRATVSGLSFEDLRTLITAASLHWYEQEKKHPGGKGLGCSTKGCRCGENYHQNQERLIEGLKEAVDGQIKATFPAQPEAPLKERLRAGQQKRRNFEALMKRIEEAHERMKDPA